MTTTIEATATTIASHNGTLTIKSIETGAHRTFQIKTQKEDSSFRPGSRLVSLLVGSDNESDFQTFGELIETFDGIKIQVWRKHLGTQFEKLARMLANLENLEDSGKIEILFATCCRRCNRKLTTPESIRSGIGPVCAEKE